MLKWEVSKMRNMIKGVADRALEKAISRKLLVWLTATGLTLSGGLDSGDWVIISAIYLGSQGIIDAIVKLRA